MKKIFESELFHAIAKLAMSITVLLLVINSYRVNRQMHRIADNQWTITQGINVLAEKMIEKATWDKKVAEKIRELDEYVKTNQTVQGTIRGVQ